LKNSKVLNFPFFTLEYRAGVFVRRIPQDAEDLGGGLFRQGGTVWRLPGGGEQGPAGEALAFGTLRGKALLSLINRGPHPLIAAGPRPAGPEERIVELALVRENGGPRSTGPAAERPGGGPVVMELRRTGLDESEPLEGLPHHRWYQNTVYEVIDDGTLAELEAAFGAPGKPGRLILRGDEIPRFVETRPRLIYRFAGTALRKLLAEDSVFIPGGELSLILSARRGRGQVRARPLIAWGGRRYEGAEISAMLDRDYLLLDDLWARRTDIEKTGLFPLGFYAGGGAVEDVKLSAPELIRRGGGRFAGFFAGLEADTGLWLDRGSRETLFAAHLNFLLAWGLSGGLIFPGHREQARLLAAWLGGLPRPLKTLTLVEKRYADLYLAPQALELRERLAFYEDLPLPEGKFFWDLLILVEPEEVLLNDADKTPREDFFSRIAGINAGQRLGIFSDGWGITEGPAANRIRALFGLRGEAAEITDRLFRDPARPLPLPAFQFPPPAILRPPRPFGEGLLFRSAVEARFRDLPAAALLSELACFGEAGEEAPYAPPPAGTPDFDRLDQAERAFFLHWRHRFRRGTPEADGIPQSAEAYIRLYARELCLFTGPEAARRPENHFRELLRLQAAYGEDFPGLNSFLPQWLLDFALLYELGAESLSPVIPLGRESPSPLLYDLYLHRHFIDENNVIAAADLRGLVPELAGPEEPLSGDLPPDPRLLRDFELAVNTVDRALRERFQLRLFSFFYPPAAAVRRFTAFAGMAAAGLSAYTAEWVHFSGHPPLLRFLGDLFRYTEYWFDVKKGRDKKSAAPPLDQVWRAMVDPALTGADQFPVPRSGGSSAGPGQYAAEAVPARAEPAAGRRFRPEPVQLRLEFLDRLRAESDEVREMLTTEEPQSGAEDRAVSMPAAEQSGGDECTGDFWGELAETEREVLRVLLRGGGAAELEGWARERGLMAELLIDGINEKFLDHFGDLLVETVDEGPRIQAEYTDEVKRRVGGT
jgi:hypothetical protein